MFSRRVTPRPSAAPPRSWWVADTLLGALILLAPAFGCSSSDEARPQRPDASDRPNGAANKSASADEGEPDAPSLPVTGDVHTSVTDFGIDDPEGHRVLTVEHLEAAVDVDGLRRSLLRMPSGTAEGVELVLRRGESGRASISEAMHGGPPPPPKKARAKASQGMLLDIGPLEAKDVRLRVEMSATPVIVHLDRAQIRVKRDGPERATRILLDDIEGKMVQPDPLPDGIRIHDGGGTVDLSGDPLVDLKVRVCVANGELRLQIVVPERDPERTKMIAEGERFMGVTAVGALNIADWFKDSISVEAGEVKVPGQRECNDDS